MISLSQRESYSAEEKNDHFTEEMLLNLQEEIRNKEKSWWIGKFVKVQLLEQKEQQVGEVIAVNQEGIVIRLVEEDEPVIVPDIKSEFVHCWVILKEGYFNLFVC